MTRPYLSQQPIDDFSLQFSDQLYSVTLAATTDTSFTVPGQAPRYKALIKATSAVWIALNATAAIPAGGSFVATTSELLNAGGTLCREVTSGAVIHFFSPAGTPAVSISLYSIIS